MSKMILEEIAPFFSYLFDQYGFQKVEDAYDPDHFGDALVVLQSSDFRLRFVKDRGQVFVDVGPHSQQEKWHSLPYVLEFLRLDETWRATLSTPDLKELAKSLSANYEKVRVVFNQENYPLMEKDLESFEKVKSQQLITELLRESNP